MEQRWGMHTKRIITKWWFFHCLYVCIVSGEHKLLPRDFVETMLSFVSLGKSFQWINALLPSLPIYQPVCALSQCSDAVVSCSPVCLASSKTYPDNTPHMSAPVRVQSCVIPACDHLLAEEEERLVTAGSWCVSAHGSFSSQLKATNHAELGASRTSHTHQ